MKNVSYNPTMPKQSKEASLCNLPPKYPKLVQTTQRHTPACVMGTSSRKQHVKKLFRLNGVVKHLVETSEVALPQHSFGYIPSISRLHPARSSTSRMQGPLSSHRQSAPTKPSTIFSRTPVV